MPVYEYTALDIKGKKISGIIDIESAAAARQKLRVSSIFPVTIKEVYQTAGKKEAGSPSFTVPFARISYAEISMMTRQLATLIGAGFTLVSALYTLVPQCRSHALKRVLSRVKDSIEEGKSFAESLSPYPDIFSPIYMNMVRAGESSGTLEIVLDRLADISERQQKLRQRVQSIMVYPTIMLILGIIILFFLMTVIVPSITAIFTDMKQALPAPTVILIHISDILRTFWWLILGFVAGIIVAYKSIRKTEKGKFLIDKVILRMPVVGALTRKLSVARFSRTLGSLLENGVPMMSALDIVKNVVGNTVIASAIGTAATDVEKGRGLGQSLSASSAFPHLSIQMILVGEQSGELEAMLNKVADIFENEVESTMISLTSLLEPMIIVFMAVIVAFIILSIILPIIDMNQFVR